MPVDIRKIAIGERYTRPELAKIWGYKGYEALAKGVVMPKAASVILLFVTHIKQEAQTQYRDYVSGDYLYWEGERAHRSDERIARAHEEGNEVHLFYREIHHSAFLYYGALEIRRYVPHVERPSQFTFRVVHDLGPLDDVGRLEPELARLPETERETIVAARIGQGEFRDALLRLWGGCAVTQIRNPGLLRASHIKPWRDSSNSERLNPHNGLLLISQYDHLFDRGFVSFANSGTLLISEAICDLPTDLIGIERHARLAHVHREQLEFLEYHRDVVFVKQTSED